MIEQIDELGEAEVLDRLDVLHETQRRAEAEVLQLAVQFAILHDEHTLDPMSRGMDGREKAIRFGGAGHAAGDRVLRRRLRRPPAADPVGGAPADGRRPRPQAPAASAVAPGSGARGEGVLRPLRRQEDP